MGLKKTQPGPKYKTPQGPEKGDRKDRSSEDGNKPASSKRENPFADLEVAYKSCRVAILHLESTPDHSKETLKSWLDTIDEKLADIDKLRKKEGDASRMLDMNSSWS